MQLPFGFDYEGLNPENRLIIQQRTRELKERLQRAAQDIWEIGQKLAEVRSQLKRGQFDSWLKAEFGWSRRTAYNFINVYETFRDCANFAQIDIAPSALYRLALPSTPQEVRDVFIQQANTGAKVTHKDIHQAISRKKPKSLPVEIYNQSVHPDLLPETVVKQPITTAVIQSSVVTQEQKTTPQLTATAINSNRNSQSKWYLIEGQHLLFCGDINSKQFIDRLPFAAIALGVYNKEWHYQWLIDKARATIVLNQYELLEQKFTEQLFLMFSKRGEAVIFPSLPDGKIIALVHRMGRRLYTGDGNLELCNQAIAQSGLKAEKVDLP